MIEKKKLIWFPEFRESINFKIETFKYVNSVLRYLGAFIFALRLKYMQWKRL